jgi:hypothetical protein
MASAACAPNAPARITVEARRMDLIFISDLPAPLRAQIVHSLQDSALHQNVCSNMATLPTQMRGLYLTWKKHRQALNHGVAF